MPSPTINSPIGNAVLQRQRLSAVRQRVGLEPQGTQMRQLAPSPPMGPANKPGTAQQAMQFTPERKAAMTNAMRSFVQQIPFATEANRQEWDPKPKEKPVLNNDLPPVHDQPKAPPQQPPTPPETISQPPAPAPPRSEGTHAPLPVPPQVEHLRKREIAKQAAMELEVRLGRKPTVTELKLFLEKPKVTRGR